MVIEAAVVAIHRFRRETGGVIAARIEETLKDLRSADPRVIAALARQPAKSLTVRNDKGDAARRLQPPDRAGHRRIDKAITALEAELGVNDTIYELRKRNP